MNFYVYYQGEVGVEESEGGDVRVGVRVDGGRYTTEELSLWVAVSFVCALVLGFISGFCIAR